MFKRVTQCLIGKDVSRTASLVIYEWASAVTANAVEGEVIVLDKNKQILTPGYTTVESPVIYIAQVTSETVSYVDPLTPATTYGALKLIFSDPIEGDLVKSYQKRAYTAATAAVVAINDTATVFVKGTENYCRIIYKDLPEHPGQFTKTYRWIGTSATNDTECAVLAALIQKDANRRIDCTFSTPTLTFTAKDIPACTTSLTDIDKFSQVDFEVIFGYIDTDGNWTKHLVTSYTKTAPKPGTGTWVLVRDAEKDTWANRGIVSQTTWPALKPDAFTVKSETYDCVSIEHNKSYRAPDNQYGKEFILATEIFIPNTATNNQMDDVLACLNPWMASTRGKFAAIYF
jgi:hypothetical protein